jgi:hypothetical protein
LVAHLAGIKTVTRQEAVVVSGATDRDVRHAA